VSFLSLSWQKYTADKDTRALTVVDTADAPEDNAVVVDEETIDNSRHRECVICFCDFKDGQEIGWSQNCEHVFCKDCIRSWLLKHPDCPCCRRKFLTAAPEIEKGAGQGEESTNAADIEHGDTGPMEGSTNTTLVDNDTGDCGTSVNLPAVVDALN